MADISANMLWPSSARLEESHYMLAETSATTTETGLIPDSSDNLLKLSTHGSLQASSLKGDELTANTARIIQSYV